MAKCEVCGNEYDKAFKVIFEDGRPHVFDAFECAIHTLAPICGHCRCRIMGHGVEQDDAIFCSAHCAREMGVAGARDRV